MKLASFAADTPILPALAARWLAAGHAQGLIILPSRRAAQALAGAFLEANGGKSLLLPRIVALGGLDEAGLALAGALEGLPAVAPMQRQALLTALILKLDESTGAPRRLPFAWALAAELAHLLDEADAAGVDLASALPGLVAGELAQHWQVTLEFLTIVTRHWPAILAGLGAQNQAARQAWLLAAQAQAWTDAPPEYPVWLVTRDTTPAAVRLAKVVAGLPAGWVILPGFDFTMRPEAFAMLEESHAQAGAAALLSGLGARVEEVERWGPPPGDRAALLSRALAPAGDLQSWREVAPPEVGGISLLKAADEAEEGQAIALILRDALEIPGRTAALVTPDRALAVRVASHLARLGVRAEDSAGEPLAQTPPAILLRLVARSVASQFAPLDLLALLKHPLAALGLPPGRARALARGLELAALRGARPAPGLDEIKFRLRDERHAALTVFVERFEAMIRPAVPAQAVSPAAALRGLIEAAEALAATPEESGPAILWSGEAGVALSALLSEALLALAALPDIPAADVPETLDALLEGAVVRRPRARDGHPRVAIWGVQEARLQHVDVLVLGGLIEGVWPAAAEPGPWLSRPMRRAAGLPSPEQALGTAAHDFWTLSAAAGEVVLSAPLRRARAPAVPARWLTRLVAYLAGAGRALPLNPAAGWAASLDQPAARRRRARPYPKPPVASRPTTYSISDIATLMGDPYALYARKILRLAPLDPLDEESDASLFGDIVHAGLEMFFKHEVVGPDMRARLTARLLAAMAERRPREALSAWWAARLARIAGWVADEEFARRVRFGDPVAMALEHAGEMNLGKNFVLRGRADRIERRADQKIAIFDYKTGTLPSNKDVNEGRAPQLVLEGMIAQGGEFGDEFYGEVDELVYWRLTGRQVPGEARQVEGDDVPLSELIGTAPARVSALLADFARAERAWIAVRTGRRADYADEYAGLSRRGEWAAEGEDGSE
jgi:ATP-dependent helicase/nuclease subunit B